MHVNEAGYNRRLDAVQKILKSYGLKSSRVAPIAYDPFCPFHFNNFIYKVDLQTPALPGTFHPAQPCTEAPPLGVWKVIIRISNPLAEGINNANRVQNDVAAQHLARQSIDSIELKPVVPAVYAWAPCRYPEIPDETGFGWTICEYKPGSDLDGKFALLSLDDAKDVIRQLAGVFTAIQNARIPDSVSGFGGLNIDDSGNIVAGQPPLLEGGPWDTYEEFWTARLRARLSEAEKSRVIAGWASGGVRERIDEFVEAGGIGKMLEGVDNSRVLVHGDLTMNNILYSSETNRITAVLDFDWSAISHPCEEFLTGLWDIGGGIHERNRLFQPMLLSGDFGIQPKDLSTDDIRQWELAKAWDKALTDTGAIRPSKIAGVRRIQALKDLDDLLCPFDLCNEFVSSRASDKENLAKKRETGVNILKWIDTHWTVK
ncbi:hypothetical protein F5Y04DRAFT_263094 [Hypomontagnella monticulosa]|nr:hypothetical protein F5Y04DRAFT_263094 [Hypomontagnella monticulosa]